MRKAISAAAVFAVLVVPAAIAIAGNTIKTAQTVTDRYHHLSAAKADGYARLIDQQGISCIAQQGTGAMGIHYVNSKLVGNPAIDPKHPEAVIYEPGSDGTLRLVALEWVVIKSDWDKHHSSRPQLFGQQFQLTKSPNRFGLPPFYSLHAWVWKNNPSGKFKPWNPRVSCKNAKT
jgi:hypothetical protein